MTEAWTINDATAARIRRMYDDGASIYSLTDDTGLSIPSITRILDNRICQPEPGPLMPSSLPRELLPEWQPCELECPRVFARMMALAQRTSPFEDQPA